MRITVAGANGFVGKNFLQGAPKDWEICGLSRGNPKTSQSNLSWRQADLFSFQSSLQALEGTDVAVYLVHSMLPSTRLFQGNFADADLLIADNFAHACQKQGVKQIIYLGGLMPEGPSSKHLESRLEVEEVFRTCGVPYTIFRAGMVAGSGGSSFEILRNLVSRLPTMLLPRWTQVKTQAIYVDDLVRVLSHSVMNPEFFDSVIDLVNGESLTYEDLIRKTCLAMGRKPILLRAPINSTGFSKLWVSFFGRTSYELVSPLIDSLLCELPQHEPEPRIAQLIQFRSYEKMLDVILKQPKPKQSRPGKQVSDNTVRSIQRLPSLPKHNSEEIARLYRSWVSRAFLGLIRVQTEDSNRILKFWLRGFPRPLLVLQHIPDEEPEVERIKFHIVGGVLCKKSNTGWLEFRQVACRKFTLASINEFIPTLPWYLYRFSQAVIHKYVMLAFGRYLNTLKD